MLLKGSFEDILYVLIGIVWVAFSIYQAKKKKKQKSLSQPDEKKKKSFFETLLDEMSEQNQQQTDISNDDVATVVKPEAELKSEYITYNDYYEEGNYNEAKDVIVTNEPLTQQIPNQVLKSHLANRKKLRFDLKKAVIYSEILKPKYF